MIWLSMSGTCSRRCVFGVAGRAGHYLRGFMLDGRRKSIQPMVARLQGPHEQALNHFVTNSPWQVAPVRRRIAERIDEALEGPAWAIGDTGLLKYGRASPGGSAIHRHRREDHELPGRGIGQPGHRDGRPARSTGGCFCQRPGIRPRPKRPRTWCGGALRPRSRTRSCISRSGASPWT